MFAKLKQLNDKYDMWSFLSDFMFVFGVLVLGWSPVLLILLFIIDTSVMIIFTNILFHLENKDWIKTVGFIIISPMLLGLLVAFYISIIDFIKELKLDDVINADPSQVINPYIFPIILVSSGLNHYAAFSESLHKMKEGTYKSSFIKHFFLRYILIMALIVFIVFFQFYLNASIVVALIAIKAFLRVWKKNYRTII